MTLTRRQEQRRVRERQRIAAAERTATDDVAVAIWGLLVSAAHDGASLSELEEALPGYSRASLRAGIERIRYVLDTTGEPTLVCLSIRGRGSVYKLPERVGEYQAYTVRQLTTALSLIANQIRRAEAAIIAWPDGIPPYFPKHLRRLAEDTEDLRAALLGDETDDQG